MNSSSLNIIDLKVSSSHLGVALFPRKSLDVDSILTLSKVSRFDLTFKLELVVIISQASLFVFPDFAVIDWYYPSII
jgi:hypothetical protein